VRGQFAAGQATRFLTTSKQTLSIEPSEIASRKVDWYVSFPPLPAVVMMPVVAAFGLRTNDILLTVLIAALVPALLLGLLRRLRDRGLSRRTDREDLWLVALFGVGSVFYYCSVIGEVWHTAHVIGCLCVLGYVYFSLEAASPVLAGLFLALGVADRALPLLLLFPFFLFEAWRCRRKELVSVLLRFAAFPAVIGPMLAWFNYARFGSPLEWGHSYLAVRWASRIQQWGLVNYHFLSRNVAAAFTLIPKFVRHSPYVQISRHGMSLFITTPALLYLVWPRERPPIHRALWLTVLCVSIPTFLYQNDGYVQFGYRFSLDYMIMLVVLLAVGSRPLTRTFQALILFGIVVNLIGAVTFNGLGSGMYFDGFFPAE
jgi:hypothetical protein